MLVVSCKFWSYLVQQTLTLGVNTETSVDTETMDKISVAWQYYGNEKNISHLMVQKFPCILNTQKQS